MTRFTKLSRKTFNEPTAFNAAPLKRRRFEKPQEPVEQSKRAQRRKQQKINKMQCFSCRKYGHSVNDCPEKSTDTICFKCGQKGHSIQKCRVKTDPQNPFPFAVCFVCNEKGHLAGSCEKNANGFYPNGGGCKFCGSNRHLAKDCKPLKKTDQIELGKMDLEQGADDDDVFIALRKIQKETATKKPLNKKIVSF